jgi:hypothetical protein
MSDAPGAAMPGADPFQLLENSAEVQADLGLSREQLQRLSLAGRNFRTKLQELSYPRPGVSNGAAKAEIERHLLDTRGMIARELTPGQLGRLQQIMLQLEGPCLAVVDRQLGQQLGLSPDQDRAVAEACGRRADLIRQSFQPPRGREDFCAVMMGNRDRVEKVRASADARILTLLSPQQNTMFKRMAGKKIELEPPMPPECR